MGNVSVTPNKDLSLLAAHIAGMEKSEFEAWARVVIEGLKARADDCDDEKMRSALFSFAQTAREQLAALT